MERSTRALDPTTQALIADVLMEPATRSIIRSRLSRRSHLDPDDIRQRTWTHLLDSVARLPVAEQGNLVVIRRLRSSAIRTAIREEAEASATTSKNRQRLAASLALVVATLPPSADNETIISRWRDEHPTWEVSDALLRSVLEQGAHLPVSIDAAATAHSVERVDRIGEVDTMEAYRRCAAGLSADERMLLEQRLDLREMGQGVSQRRLIAHMAGQGWSERKVRSVDASLAGQLERAVGM